MEHPSVGQHCNFKQCNTLDFLPFICDFCKNTFCKDHFEFTKHGCLNVPLNVANVCEEKDNKNIKCYLEGCCNMELLSMPCMKCKNHYCLPHRHHGCYDFTKNEKEDAKLKLSKPREEFAIALNEVNMQINASIEKTMGRSDKSRQTALKVQLMRLKGKAVGQASIPVADRIYFLIYPPKQTKKKSKAVYVSKEWSLGRVIDASSSLCDIPNKNNQAHEPKLRLFKKGNGLLISNDMSCRLNEFLEKGDINSGESLILEYVESDVLSSCTSIDSETYTE